MSKSASIIAVLVVLVLVVLYSRRAAPPAITSTFAEGDVVGVSCPNPQVVSASFGPQQSSATCPTADVTAAVQALLGTDKPFNATTADLGVTAQCGGTPRQLSVTFTCPATTTDGSSSSTTYGSGGTAANIASRKGEHITDTSQHSMSVSRSESFTSDRPLRATPYSQGPPLAESVWSDAASLNDDPARQKATHGLPHRVLTGADAGDALTEALRDTDAEALGVYLPGNMHGPKREPGWAIRPGKRRTNWVP